MRPLITTAIFSALAVGMFFGAARPILDAIGEKSVEKASLEDVLKQFNDIRKAKNDLIDAYNSVGEDEMARIVKVVPPMANEGEILVAFEKMAKDSGLLLKRIDIKPATSKSTGVLVADEAPFDKVSVSVMLDGSYDSFGVFLKNSLEKSLRIIDVRALSFHAGEQSSSHEFTLDADAYMQKQPKK